MSACPWPPCYFSLLVGVFVIATTAAPTNITISVAAGTSNHGNPNLLCTQLSWTAIVVFFLGNYVAHAATVRRVLGQSNISAIGSRITAAFLPAVGLQRGIVLIQTFAIFGDSELEVATRAGVLCMLARDANWQPKDGDVVEHGTA